MSGRRRIATGTALRAAAAGAALAAVAALAADGAAAAAEPDLRIQVECTTEHVCSVTIRDAADPAMRPVTTRFQADRLDAQGEWLPGVADGEFDNPKPGAYLLTFYLVEGEDGVIRNATREDPPDALLIEKITLVLDERGHVVYFHGVVHKRGDTAVLRSCLWGRPPGTYRRVE